MSLKLTILDLLTIEVGVAAQELAQRLKQDKAEVNSCLYSLEAEGLVHRQNDLDASNRRPLWFSGPPEARIVSTARSSSGASVPSDSARASVVQSSPGSAKPRYLPTTEQLPVIEAKPNARLFIEAGPGTGKSETLVARLKYLLGPGGLNPAQVLVLSFSVAAVKELKARIERQAADHSVLAFVEIRTFDSYASRLLRQLIPSSELQGLNYDERILRATQQIKNTPAAIRSLASLKHVFLDEMQDLVGVRADFALALLTAVNPGFTLFGDSAQGIYDFTIEYGPSNTTSGNLIKAIRATFQDLDERHRFTKNHRAAGNPRLESIAHEGRTLLLQSTDKARAFLEQEFKALNNNGSTGAPQIHSSLLNGSTCVVCRTNGQVFRLAGQLLERGIPFQLARDKHEFLPPAWLGRVFLGWQDDPVRKAPFLDRARAVLKVDEAAALSLWSGLLAACATPKSVSFSLSDLRAAITDGVVFPEHSLYPRSPDAIHLSTIHRSKGREFGNVIAVMNTGDGATFARKGEDRMDDPSEPRVLFVALTRARDSLHRMEAKAKGIWLPDERWIRSFRQDNGFVKLSCIQAGLPRDVDNLSFARGKLPKVRMLQDHLLKHAMPGTPVKLELLHREDRCPIYQILIADTVVGCMSTNFGWSVWHTLKNLNDYNPRRFPSRITGLWIKEMVTAVGDLADDTVDDSLRTSGLWMSLALEGLGNCSSQWIEL